MGEPTDITIRPAQPSDMPALGPMGEALCRSHHDLDPQRFFVWENMAAGYGSYLGRELENERAILLVACKATRVIGYAYGRIEPREYNSLRDECGVGIDFYVEPNERRAGAGRKLCEGLMAAFRDRGAPRIVIQAAARNQSAVRFYEALGFRRTMIEMAHELGDSAPPTEGAVT